jgi:hypothetical protein
LFHSKKKKKGKKRNEKRHSSMVCECWWAPDGIGSPWFVKGKRWGEVPNFIKEHKSVNLSLKNLLIFVWKIVRTPLPVIDKDNHLSKPNLYLSVLQMKSSSTCLITAFLCKGSFFTFMLILHLLPLCTM